MIGFWSRPTALLERFSSRGEGDFAVLQGGSPVAEFFRLTAEQMRDRVLASGALSEERLDQAIALLKDPDFWAFTDGMAPRPDTTFGTVNADVLQRFAPGFQRGNFVDIIETSNWPE